MHLSLQTIVTFTTLCTLSVHTLAHQRPYEAGAVVQVALPTPIAAASTEVDDNALENQGDENAAVSPPQITAAPLELRDARADPDPDPAKKKPKVDNSNGNSTTASSPATRAAPAAGMAFLGMLGAAMV